MKYQLIVPQSNASSKYAKRCKTLEYQSQKDSPERLSSCSHRTADTWKKELEPRLKELNITLGQVVSDLLLGAEISSL